MAERTARETTGLEPPLRATFVLSAVQRKAQGCRRK